MTSAYIKQLQAQAEQGAAAQAADDAAGRDAKAKAARERLSPLDDRLAKLLATIPAEVASEGLSLMALVPMLRGRWRPNANAGQVGGALRRLGWKKTRPWRGAGVSFAAVWMPPSC